MMCDRFSKDAGAIFSIELEQDHKDAPDKRLCNCEPLSACVFLNPSEPPGRVSQTPHRAPAQKSSLVPREATGPEIALFTSRSLGHCANPRGGLPNWQAPSRRTCIRSVIVDGLENRQRTIGSA